MSQTGQTDRQTDRTGNGLIAQLTVLQTVAQKPHLQNGLPYWAAIMTGTTSAKISIFQQFFSLPLWSQFSENPEISPSGNSRCSRTADVYYKRRVYSTYWYRVSCSRTP